MSKCKREEERKKRAKLLFQMSHTKAKKKKK